MLNGYCQFSLWQLVFQDYVKIAKKQQQQKQGQNKKAKNKRIITSNSKRAIVNKKQMQKSKETVLKIKPN